MGHLEKSHMADTPIAWTAIPPGTAFAASDGQPVGHVEEVLGSRAEDIFHGLTVRVGGRRVTVLAAQVQSITASQVTSTLSSAEVSSLSAEHEGSAFHARERGLLGTHVREREHFEKDEPGR
jgi:hypothetical protein